VTRLKLVHGETIQTHREIVTNFILRTTHHTINESRVEGLFYVSRLVEKVDDSVIIYSSISSSALMWPLSARKLESVHVETSRSLTLPATCMPTYILCDTDIGVKTSASLLIHVLQRYLSGRVSFSSSLPFHGCVPPINEVLRKFARMVSR